MEDNYNTVNLLNKTNDEAQESTGSKLTKKEIDFVRELIYKTAGISLNESKAVMIEARLVKRLRALNMESYSDYLNMLESDSVELTEFTNALTTNKTEFFREAKHFDFLKNHFLPNYKVNGSRLLAWCAASSTGEEIYTLSFVLNEYMENSGGQDYRILGTDIDTKVLADAEAGVYRQELVERDVDPNLIKKYFQKGRGNNEGYYRVCSAIKEKTKFRQHNLINSEPYDGMLFDVIFLRNVLIYFDQETIQNVIDRLTVNLRQGGALFIGHSETLNHIKHDLTQVSVAVFQKK